MTLQAATHADRSTVLGMMAEYYAFDRLDFDSAKAGVALDQLLADSTRGTVYLIQHEDRISGYVVVAWMHSLEFHGRVAFIDELFLAASARGRGLGRQVVERLEQECRGLGATALRLEVEHANTDARGVYERLGFAAHERDIMTKRLR